MSDMSGYENTDIMGGAAAGHFADAAQFMGPGSGGNAQGDITAGKGGDASINEAGFSGAEVDVHVNDANITMPSDTVQTETNLHPVST